MKLIWGRNTLAFILALGSFNVNAALLQADWKTAGDNLIVVDTATSLGWLKLTETNNFSYNDVSAQLGSGGLYDGMRFASNAEVVNMFTNFGINLSNTASTYQSISDPNIQPAAETLGNTMNEYQPWDYDYGVVGYTGEVCGTGRCLLGAFRFIGGGPSTYYYDGSGRFSGTTGAVLAYGTYLVQPAAVPVPAAVWLFGSGLLALISLAKRKA